MTPDEQREALAEVERARLVQRAKEIDAGYAGIVIPPAALADIEREANIRISTTRNSPGGPLDPYETFFMEGKRALWLHIMQRIERAKRRQEDTQTKAVSATAESA